MNKQETKGIILLMNSFEGTYTQETPAPAPQAVPAPAPQAAYGQAPAQSYYGQMPQTTYSYPQQVPAVYANGYKQPSGWGKLWGAFGLAFAVLIIQSIAVLFGLLTGSDDAMLSIGEIAGGIAAILFIWALGGKMLAAPSLAGLRETWHIVRWIFLADAVIAVIDFASILLDESFTLAQLWPLRIALLFIMCAGIGLFEEATFRGLVFHGLLARMGLNEKGVFWAVVISSVVFGCMHIDVFGMNWSDPSQAAQALLKIAQTGIFGFAAAAAVLKTGNIWPIALFHGLNDFMLMIASNGLMSSPVTTEYVTEGSNGILAIGIYVVLCAAYIPSLIASLKVLKEHGAPDRGQFYKANQPPVSYAPAVYAPVAYAPTIQPAPTYVPVAYPQATPMQTGQTAQVVQPSSNQPYQVNQLGNSGQMGQTVQ